MSNQQELERIQWVKINYFCSKLGINDISRAEKYLNKANWDEILAVRNFNLSHPNYISIIPQYNHQTYQAPFYFNQMQFPYYQNIAYQMPQIPQMPQISQSNNREVVSNNNKNQNKRNFIEFYLSESINNCKENNIDSSHSLNYLKNKLNSIELLFRNYLTSLKNKRGIIIIYSEENFNILKEHIEKISQNYIIKNLLNKCVIFPVLNTSSIGHEFVEQLSCVNFPTYIFNKYKNNKYFYITGRMDGAFDISSFKENIENISYPDAISNILKNENNNDLIHKLKQEKYFNINNQFKNRKDNNNKNIINRKNENNKINRKNIFEEEKQIELMKNYDNYYLGDSKDIISIFEDNNNNNYINNQYKMNNYEESFLNNKEEKKENLDRMMIN